MTSDIGAEGETSPRLFVHPLHLHFCAALPAVMKRCESGIGVAGAGIGTVVRQALEIARAGYSLVEGAINAEEKQRQNTVPHAEENADLHKEG